jgi:hypothetical protein
MQSKFKYTFCKEKMNITKKKSSNLGIGFFRDKMIPIPTVHYRPTMCLNNKICVKISVYVFKYLYMCSNICICVQKSIHVYMFKSIYMCLFKRLHTLHSWKTYVNIWRTFECLLSKTLMM